MQVERDLGIVVPVTRLLKGPSVASLAGWLAGHLPVAAAGTPATRPDKAPQKIAPEETAPQKTDGEPSRGIDLLIRVPELSDDAVEELLQKVLAERGAERELAVKEGSDDG